MTEPDDAGPSPRKDPIASIAGQIRHLSNGERSSLRRMDVGSNPGSEGLLIAVLIRAGVRMAGMDAEELASWRAVVHAAAVMSGSANGPSHAPGRSLGRRLAKAGLSRDRLIRLAISMDAKAVSRAVRLVSSKDAGVFDLSAVRGLTSPEPTERAAAVSDLIREYTAAQVRAEGKEAK